MTEEIKTEEVNAEEKKILCSTETKIVGYLITHIVELVILLLIAPLLFVLAPVLGVIDPLWVAIGYGFAVLLSVGDVIIVLIYGIIYIFEFLGGLVSRAHITEDSIYGRTLFSRFDIPLDRVSGVSVIKKKKLIIIRAVTPEGDKKKYKIRLKGNVSEFQSVYVTALAKFSAAKTAASADVSVSSAE